MLKRCGHCGADKPIEEFHRRGSVQQNWCKPCRCEYDAAYWRRTRAERLRQRKLRRQERAAWYRGLKEEKPCADCGVSYHHTAMHWDHLPGVDKTREVSNLLRKGLRRRTILEEIAKCELVCANCHAVRTFDRLRGVAQSG
jgi:hypothetical protein